MGKERIEKENHKEGFGMLGRKVDLWEQFKFKSFRSLYQAGPTAYCLLFLHSFPPVRFFKEKGGQDLLQKFS
jgi:hypothetical protein